MVIFVSGLGVTASKKMADAGSSDIFYILYISMAVNKDFNIPMDWIHSLTAAYDYIGRCRRQRLVFGIIQLIVF